MRRLCRACAERTRVGCTHCLDRDHRADAAAESVRGAVARGATAIWLPRLEPWVAAEIEAKRLHFIQARDGISPEGRRVTPMGLFDRSRVRRWLDRMATEFEPVQSWLPT